MVEERERPGLVRVEDRRPESGVVLKRRPRYRPLLTLLDDRCTNRVKTALGADAVMESIDECGNVLFELPERCDVDSAPRRNIAQCDKL